VNLSGLLQAKSFTVIWGSSMTENYSLPGASHMAKSFVIAHTAMIAVMDSRFQKIPA
jgi:hypothetical protein